MISNDSEGIRQNNLTILPQSQLKQAFPDNMQHKYVDFSEFVKSSRFNEKSRTRHCVSYSKMWSAKVGL